MPKRIYYDKMFWKKLLRILPLRFYGCRGYGGEKYYSTIQRNK